MSLYEDLYVLPTNLECNIIQFKVSKTSLSFETYDLVIVMFVNCSRLSFVIRELQNATQIVTDLAF